MSNPKFEGEFEKIADTLNAGLKEKTGVPNAPIILNLAMEMCSRLGELMVKSVSHAETVKVTNQLIHAFDTEFGGQENAQKIVRSPEFIISISSLLRMCIVSYVSAMLMESLKDGNK